MASDAPRAAAFVAGTDAGGIDSGATLIPERPAGAVAAVDVARAIGELRESLNTLGIILNRLGLPPQTRVLDIGGAVQGGQESTRFLLEAFEGPIDAVGLSDNEQSFTAAYGERVRLRASVANGAAVQYDLVLLCPIVARTVRDLRDFAIAFPELVAPGGYLICHGVLPGIVGNPAYIQPPPAVGLEFSESFALSEAGELQLPPYLAEYECYGAFPRKTRNRSFLAWYVLKKRSEEELRALRAANPAPVIAALSEAEQQTPERPALGLSLPERASEEIAVGALGLEPLATTEDMSPFEARIARLLSRVQRFGPAEYETILPRIRFEEVPAEVSELLQSHRFDSVMFVNNRFKIDARPMKMVQAVDDFGRKPLAVGLNLTAEYALQDIGGSIPLVLLPNYNSQISRQIRRQKLPQHTGGRYELWMAAAAVCLADLLIELRHKPPLLILHSHDFTGAFVGGTVARLAKTAEPLARTAIKWIHDIHEFVREYDIIDPTLQQIACRWEEAFYPRADALLTVTAPLSDRIFQFYDVKKAPTVIYNCNRLTARYKYKGPGCREVSGCGDAPLMVHSGAIKPGRGVEYLIRAMAHLPELHLLLLTGTEDDYVARVVEEAERLGVRQRVHFHPLLPYDEVAGFIADADAGMIPMEHYGNSNVSLPNKFFDYIMAGLPVVSADTDNLKELMSDWPVGRLFPAGDVAALATAIADVLCDARKYRRAIQSRPDLLLGFAWEAQAVKLYDLYGGLARDNQQRYHLQLPEY